MATTSPDNIRTPNAGDQYALVQDLGVMADSIQTALTKRANSFQGTAAQRTAFTSTATNGMLWQDTDSIKMIWRKDGSAWVPAVWRWSGTTTQMNAFAAPNGFEWFNTTDSSEYVRIGGAWRGNTEWATVVAGVRWMRRADAIYLDVAKSQTIAAGSTGVLGTLPLAARPPYTWNIPSSAPGIYPMVTIVGANGVIETRNTNAASTSSVNASGSWPAP